jgi:hypothetical protein
MAQWRHVVVLSFSKRLTELDHSLERSVGNRLYVKGEVVLSVESNESHREILE